MDEGFNKIVESINRMKETSKIESYIEEELNILEKALNKISIDENYLNTVVIPQIEKIKKIILKLDEGRKSNDNFITFQALKSISDEKIGKIKRKFNYLNNKFFNINKKVIKSIKKAEDDYKPWWKRQEDQEERSAEIWAQTHQKNKDTN